MIEKRAFQQMWMFGAAGLELEAGGVFALHPRDSRLCHEEMELSAPFVPGFKVEVEPDTG